MKSRELVDVWCDKMDKKIKSVITFPSYKGDETFAAVHKAEDRVALLGYSQGSMCGDEPIALSNDPKCTYIAKWKNIDKSEWEKINGLIVSGDFREGDVSIVFFA